MSINKKKVGEKIRQRIDDLYFLLADESCSRRSTELIKLIKINKNYYEYFTGEKYKR